MTIFLSLYRAYVTSIIFGKFHDDTPNSKGTRSQKPFLYMGGGGGGGGAGADNSNGVYFEHHRKLVSL